MAASAGLWTAVAGWLSGKPSQTSEATSNGASVQERVSLNNWQGQGGEEEVFEEIAVPQNELGRQKEEKSGMKPAHENVHNPNNRTQPNPKLEVTFFV